MKTIFTLFVAMLLAAAVSGCSRVRSKEAVNQGAAAPLAVAPQAIRVAQSTEAGRVAEVLVWGDAPVEKGQVLARLDVPASTPALLRAREAVARAATNYARQPSAPHARALARARTQLADVPRYVRNGYVLAPATGRLLRSLVVKGQYLPRAGAAALLVVPLPPPPVSRDTAGALVAR